MKSLLTLLTLLFSLSQAEAQLVVPDTFQNIQ
jgi:hypothetical protein